MKELVVISGKGGTGKTSVVASLAALAGRCVLADCDVDAADLHLVVGPRVLRSETFMAGARARLDATQCHSCGMCQEVCRFGAVVRDEPTKDCPAIYRIEELACEGCGVCAWACPASAIEMTPVAAGEWYVSETRFGLMVHARLSVAGENSGKLVSLVRQQAREIARTGGHDLVLVDGSPGVGCPVIASLTGAHFALVVTEPTVSGLHDLGRVCELTQHFRLRTAVCINKWDLHEEMSERIETFAREHGLPVVGRIRYDQAVTKAQISGLSTVEYARNGAANDLRAVWDVVQEVLRAPSKASVSSKLCTTCTSLRPQAQSEFTSS